MPKIRSKLSRNRRIMNYSEKHLKKKGKTRRRLSRKSKKLKKVRKTMKLRKSRSKKNLKVRISGGSEQPYLRECYNRMKYTTQEKIDECIRKNGLTKRKYSNVATRKKSYGSMNKSLRGVDGLITKGDIPYIIIRGVTYDSLEARLKSEGMNNVPDDDIMEELIRAEMESMVAGPLYNGNYPYNENLLIANASTKVGRNLISNPGQYPQYNKTSGEWEKVPIASTRAVLKV